jgi:F-box protein 20
MIGHGSAMVIESLGLYYHIECFRCFVCNIPLSSSHEGTDVRVRNNRLHCQNCFSDENGKKIFVIISINERLPC